MKLAEFRFRLIDGKWCLDSNPEIQLCDDGLRELWQVPSFAKLLWIELYNRPAKSRHKIMPRNRQCIENPTLLVNGRKFELLKKTYDQLKPFFLKYENIYAEVWFK